MSTPCFFHVDLDAFYASVEQTDNPQYRGKPVIVGSLPTDRRGVVSTCSYEARQYGVHSAMPIGAAYNLCPCGIFLRARMKRYHEKSREVMAILNDFSPEVRQMSIDEAFLDMSGTERLFGTAESAAHKIKKRIKTETGLTLSIGAASNKYIAKIASGLSKPDGLFIVQNGGEEDFMLSLPLKKIWGVGGKTLERIIKAGFKTPQDIHRASLNLLQSLFGSCTGSFLYHAVRGCEVETFETESKNRSVSSEHTFSFDLTDLYTIDTALLELSWELMYRLLTEDKSSKTVHVKIRYEDFTTVSIRETSTRTISSADDLFTRARNLFRKKYENGRGIRLLGLAAQNIEDGSAPVQSELFDFGEKKKAAVEKAVIQIQKKNPEIRVEKARLLNAKEELQPNKTPAQKIRPEKPPRPRSSLLSLIAGIMLALMLQGAGTELHAQNQNRTAPAKGQPKAVPFNPFAALPAGAPLASFPISPTASDEVEFFAQGSWEAKLHAWHSISADSGDPKKKTPVFSFAPPVFTQKTDLTVWFLLNKKWYFEAAVADAYEKTTVAAGYYGEGFLRHVRIGNRGIGFPRIYGIDIAGKGAGGAADQAPGITAHWEAESWQADALLRYDMLENFEKTWSGTHELGEKKIALHKWKRGIRFVLPQGGAERIASVYVESEKGSYTDVQGYSYEKLAHSDYLILPAQESLVLAKPAAGRVLAELYGGKSVITPSLNDFSSGSFLKEVQDSFGADIQVEHYSYPKHAAALTSDDFFTEVGAKNSIIKNDALILQYPPFFSPFADASFYEADFAVQSTSFSVVSAAGTEHSAYAAISADGGSFSGAVSDSDFFKEQKAYIRLFKRNAQKNGAAERYPAAKDTPLVYLTPDAFSQTDISAKYVKNADAESPPLFITAQTAVQSETLDIGSEAVPGSIVMYRNGIKETGFRYDSNTGIVHPVRPIASFDTVRIVWQQRKEGGQNGRLSAAAGIQKRFSPDFSMDGSASLLWPLTQKTSFSADGAQSTGSLSAALKLDFDKKDFSVSDTSVLSFEMPDTTGVRRVLGMDSSKVKKILLPEKADADFPEGGVPVLKERNTASPPPSFPSLPSSKRGSIQAETLRVSDMEGYVLRMTYDIPSPDFWAARTVDFKGAAASLASAREFSIWLKTDGALPNHPEIYLQLGVPDNQHTDKEVPLPTWKISDPPSALNDVKQHFDVTAAGEWRKVSVFLRDEDRVQLAKSQNARIVIYNNSTSTVQGILQVGAAEINGTSFSSFAPAGSTLHSAEKRSPVNEHSDMLRFNTDGPNTVQYFKWHIPSTVPPQDKTVSARIYTEAVNLASYDTLNFFMYIPKILAPNAADVSLIMQHESASGLQQALHLILKEEALQKIWPPSPHSGEWKKVQFDLRTHSLRIDGGELAPTAFSVEHCDINTAPNRIDFAFTANPPHPLPPPPVPPSEGELYIDELYLEGRDYRLNFENIFNFDWAKGGTVWEINGFPLAANPRIHTNVHAHAASGNLVHTDSKTSAGASADGKAQADIAGLQTAVAASFAFTNTGRQSASTWGLQNASHRIGTTPVFLFTKVFNAAEDYSFSVLAKSGKKTEQFSLDFSPFEVPLFFLFKTEGIVSPLTIKQSAVWENRWSLEKKAVLYKLHVNAQVFQQGQNAYTAANTDYFSRWLDASKIQFSGGEINADRRSFDFSVEQSIGLFQNRFEPSIRVYAQNVYGSTLKTENTAQDGITFRFPFSVRRQQFSVLWTKSSSTAFSVPKGGSYAGDSAAFVQSMHARKAAYAAAPVYDFFDDRLAENMRHDEALLSVYTSMWDLSWKRPLFSSAIDLIVPARLSFSAARDIKTSRTKGDTGIQDTRDTGIRDTLQFKTSAGFTAFNCFGTFGSIPLRGGYEQDEFVSFLSLVYKGERNNAERYRLSFSGYNQAILFFNPKDNLRFFTEYRIDTEKDWQIKFETVWDRAGKTSIIKDALTFVFSRFEAQQTGTNITIRRKNAFNAAVGEKTGQPLRQSYGLSHHTDFEFGAHTKAGVFISTEVTVGGGAFAIKNSAGISGKIAF